MSKNCGFLSGASGCRVGGFRQGSAHAIVRVSGSNEAFSPEKSRSISPLRGHGVGRQVVERRRVDQRHRVAGERAMSRWVEKRDALPLLAGQPSEQRRQRVAVRQVEEGGRLVQQDDGVSCASTRAIITR